MKVTPIQKNMHARSTCTVGVAISNSMNIVDKCLVHKLVSLCETKIKI